MSRTEPTECSKTGRTIRLFENSAVSSAALNDDEKANLVAISWIGRGAYEPEEWDEALAAARSEKTTPTAAYLLGDPLIADYLEEGMSLLGFEMAPIESDVASEG